MQKTAAVQNQHVTTTEQEKFISVKEAAAFLSVPLNTCYKLCLSRTLPSYKAGKLRRLKLSEVAAYMEGCRVEAKSSR